MAIKSPLVPPGGLGSPTTHVGSKQSRASLAKVGPETAAAGAAAAAAVGEIGRGGLSSAASWDREETGSSKLLPTAADCHPSKLDFKSYPSKNIYLIHSDMKF